MNDPHLPRAVTDSCSARLIAGLLLTWVVFTAGLAPAQVTTATILGTVYDSSGAAIPGAKVTAANVATGLKHETTTGPDGSYVLPLLPITGSYNVGVEARGFQRLVRAGIVLNINQYARVDASL